MRRRRVKIRVKIIVLEAVPLQIDMRRRMVKIRVKIIVLETVPLQIEMKGTIFSLELFFFRKEPFSPAFSHLVRGGI